MKKMVLALALLMALVGCTNTNVSNISTISNDFGTMNINRTIGKLNYKISSSWQLISIDNGLFVSIPYDNSGFGFAITYKEDDECVPITDTNYDEEIDKYFKNLDDEMENMKMTSYVHLDNVMIGGKYGLVIDSVIDQVPTRYLVLHDDGYSYVLLFQCSTRDMTSSELDFAYDYFKTLTLE